MEPNRARSGFGWEKSEDTQTHQSTSPRCVTHLRMDAALMAHTCSSALRRLRQKGKEYSASLGSTVSLVSNKETNKSEHGFMNSPLADSASLTTKENRCCRRDRSEVKSLFHHREDLSSDPSTRVRGGGSPYIGKDVQGLLVPMWRPYL